MAYRPGSHNVDIALPGATTFNLLLQPPAGGRRIIEVIYIHNAHSAPVTTLFYLSVGDAGTKRLLFNTGAIGIGKMQTIRGPFILEGTTPADRTNLWALPFFVNPTGWKFAIEYGDEMDEE